MVRKAIEIGDLNIRIKIFKETKAVSSNGVPITTKELIRECFAKHESSNIGEDEEGKIRAVYTDSFVIRRNKTANQDDSLLKNNIGLCIQKENDITNLVPSCVFSYMKKNQLLDFTTNE